MNAELKARFREKWLKYFGASPLPIVFFYSDDGKYASLEQSGARNSPGSDENCLIFRLNRVRNGEALAFSGESLGCPGGKRYTGYSAGLAPSFKYFLSCGIPGKMEGERYKKSPELVERLLANSPDIKARGKRIVFKRWDSVEADEEPLAVIFYENPDAIAGLFTLANFRNAEDQGVIAPFSAGCGSLVGLPLLESDLPVPQAVLGLFDPSARPHVGKDILTLAVPMEKFLEMEEDIDESFLITPTWERIRDRL